MSTDNSIVLFKSTFRNEYRKLLLTSLSAPPRTYFWTYYKNKHVSSDLLREAKNSPSSLEGMQVTLIFYNIKENAESIFYPLRDFTILKVVSDGSLIFELCPEEFCKYTKTELATFNKLIIEEMPLLPPRENSWAQFFSLRCLKDISRDSDQKASDNLIDYLDQDRIGKKDDFKSSIFFRLDPLKEAGSQVTYVNQDGYTLAPGKLYEWAGSFYKHRETQESFHVKLGSNDNIEPVTEQVRILPGKNQPFKLIFRCKPVYNDTDIKITVYVPEKDSEGEAPRHEIPARIIKLPLFKRIGSEGLIVLAGLVLTSLSQTLFHRSGTKVILSIIGNFLTLFGIAIWKKRN